MFTIYQRELKSYFTQPTAYAVICIFLFMSLFLTFTLGSFIQIGDANLEWSFFFWHPWIFMLLAPALGMRLWSDEQRSGTIELLGTFPTTIWSAIVGKYLAAATVWLVALLLTCPMVMAVNTLGDPDNLTIFSGYIGSYLVCCSFLAITCLISAFTRDQVSCLIISCSICVLLVIIGFRNIETEIARNFSSATTDAIVSTSVLNHLQPLLRGSIRIQDLTYFGSIIAACLVCTSAILNAKRA
ncbi:ABC transporter permease subunit [Verrucomicrobiaceae bacterium N1E253]|uniref:ABC transporter permease subunit n=1 Tax=Oceaniferula marina TaxID=2748318 RepID=A0A851G921_9BACT|nr:ABC transporter permease [Oceaniferula marina]NWK54103.1 ABC transporter permease subunit [Oceaniferula marina]